MRVIRPAAISGHGRHRPLVLALSMLAVGLLAGELTLLGSAPLPVGLAGAAAAIALGVGAAWLLRVLRPDRMRTASGALEALLASAFDDTYTLVVAPRLPVRDGRRLDALLVGPGGIRALTVRDWEGRYRVRGRAWEFDARGRRGWIRCRTNPSFEVTALADGIGRWAAGVGLEHLPLRGAVVFPWRHSRVILEEPEDEVVTTDNAPWWANAIGRARRMDPDATARFVGAVLDAAEATTSATLPARTTRAT